MPVSSRTQQNYTITLGIKGAEAVTAAVKTVESSMAKLGVSVTDTYTRMQKASETVTVTIKTLETIGNTTVEVERKIVRQQTEMEKSVNTVKTSMENMAKTAVTSNQKAEEAEKKHEGVLKGLGETAGKVADKFKEFAAEFIKGLGIGAGIMAAEQLGETVKDFTTDLIHAASAGEQFTTQMQNFYGSTQAAGQVLEWTNQQAAKMPFSLDEIRSGTAALAASGQDVARLLPALGNIAAAEHRPLMDIIDAYNRALETGNMRGFLADTRISRAELESWGVVVEKNGRIVTSTLAPALERMANARFGNAMANQANTLTGILTIIGNAFELFKERAGEGLFESLKGRFKGLLDFLQDNKGVIGQWATAFGNALGNMLGAAMNFAGWLYQHVGPPVIAVIGAIQTAWTKASPVIQAAIGAIGNAMGGIGTFLKQTVLPAVQEAIGQIVEWWNSHAKDMGKVWNDLQTGATKFWDWLSTTAKNVMKELQGVWTISWGVISGIVGVVIDLISGDWKKAKTDIINIWDAIKTGILQIANGLVDQLLHLFALMAGPMVKVLNAVFVPAFKGVVDIGVELFTFLVDKVEQAFSGLLDKMHIAFKVFAVGMTPILALLPGGSLLADKLRTDAWAGKPPLTEAQIAAHAQAAGQGAANYVGGVIGPSPIPSVTITPQQEDQWTAVINKWFKSMESPDLTTHASELGKDWWNKFTAAFKNSTLQAPQLPKWLIDLLNGKVGLPPLLPGGLGPGAIADTSGDLAKAQSQYRLDLERNQPYATLMRDRAVVARLLQQEVRSGTISAQEAALTLDSMWKEINSHFHQLSDEAVRNAQKGFDQGIVLDLPTKVLKAREKAVLDAYTRAGEGSTTEPYRIAQQTMDQQIAGRITRDVQKHIADANTTLQLDLATGSTVPLRQTLVDAAKLYKLDLQDPSISPKQAQLDFVNHLKQIYDHYLQSAQTTFNWDVQLGRPISVLYKDVDRYIELERQAGVSAAQRAVDRSNMMAQADQKAAEQINKNIALTGDRLSFDRMYGSSFQQLFKDVRQQNALELSLPASQRPDRFKLATDIGGSLLGVIQDAINSGASRATLRQGLAGEASYLKSLHILTPDQLKAFIAAGNKLIDQADTSTRKAPPSYAAAGGISGGQVGYGGVIATFGGMAHDPNQQIIAALREQLAYYKTKFQQDEKLLATNRETAGNTRGLIQAIHSIHFVMTPLPKTNTAVPALRAAGSHHPVMNP